MRSLVILSVGLFTAGMRADDQPEKVKAETKKFQGEWLCQSQQAGERKANAAGLKGLKLVIDGDQWVVSRDGKGKVRWKWKIDPSKEPKELDLFREMDGKDNVTRCLYELKDDTLAVYQHLKKPEQRPAKIGTGEDINMSVWKRETK